MSGRVGTEQAGGVGLGVLRRRWLDGQEDLPAVAGPAAPVGLASGAPLALASSAPPGPGDGGGGGTSPGFTYVTLASATQSVVEGGAGTKNVFYVVSRSGATGGTTTVNWAVSGSGDRPAAASDFVGGVLPGGSLSFAPGVLTQVITVPVRGDTTLELDEAFQVTLSGASSTSSAGTIVSNAAAGGMILTDEASISIRAVSGSSPVEGSDIIPNAPGVEMRFEIFRAGPLSGSVTVSYAAMGIAGSGFDAASIDDFRQSQWFEPAFPSGTVTFAGTETVKTISLGIRQDFLREADEGVVVVLSSPTGGVPIFQSAAVGVIREDDSIKGTSGDDVLMGIPEGGGTGVFPSSGQDLFLIGGGGLDTIFGLDQTDRFWFLPSALGPAAGNVTTLEDFSRSAGEVLDLSRIDAVTGGFSFGNEAFSFIGTTAFGGVAGQLRWQAAGAYRLIQGDVNGDSVADLTIKVKSTDTPVSSWFVL